MLTFVGFFSAILSGYNIKAEHPFLAIGFGALAVFLLA